MPKIEIQGKSQISFRKILKNKWYHAKVLLKRFHLNGHTIGFRQQTQKLELHYMFSSAILGNLFSREHPTNPLGGISVRKALVILKTNWELS